MAPKIFRYCGYCVHSKIGKTTGRVSCLHAVDEAALKNGERGTNPIWAERKFGSLGTLMNLASVVKRSGMQGPGTDPKNMDFNDGADCKTWKSNGVR